MSGHVVALRAAGTSLVLALDTALPRVLHWGHDLGDLDADALDTLGLVTVPAAPPSSLDDPAALPVLPTELDGWSGTPGLAGHRAGIAYARLVSDGPATLDRAADGGGTLRASASGDGLRVDVALALDRFGVVSVDVEVTNTGDGEYDLAGVLPQLPLPSSAGEILDLTGRWCRERSPQRSALQFGTHLRSGRRGRPGHDAPLLLTVGTPGFGFRHGEVWATHSAWSGDSTYLVERLPEGAGPAAAVLGSGELLRPGEIRLAPGASYRTPTALFAWSDTGLDGLTQRLHHRIRARPGHPATPRPLVLNTWEAVYFDQDLDTLRHLADVAAQVGVERFVIDDGWFGARRDDTRGLGDWTVSPEVWPDGLAPIIDHVHGLGMQAGLWFEPEMVNPDSDLARAHPDWLLTADAPLWRHQHVLDVANPLAFAYLLDAISGLVGEYGIDFLKWDHNRDLHGAAHVHAQTRALYRLLDELRARHPGLEIESCASGGARVDLGILDRTDRVWTSDNNDAVERQHIQRWTGLLLPPELMGAHVGPPRAHTTHRVLDLGTRCATALFGHAGIEWDITQCSVEELDVLTRWAAYYREHRGLLHGGEVVRADLDAACGALLHGVVSADRRGALFCWAQLETAVQGRPTAVRLPGLDPDLRYRVRIPDALPAPAAVEHRPPPWTAAPVDVAGSVLGSVGLAMPNLGPGQALVVELTALD